MIHSKVAESGEGGNMKEDVSKLISQSSTELTFLQRTNEKETN